MMDTHDLKTSVPRFREYLMENANRYFDDICINSVSVDLLRKADRHNSQMYEFRLTDRRTVHAVLFKVPSSATDAEATETKSQSGFERPRLFPRAAPHMKGLMEYRSLWTIHDHFSRLEDPRFGTIRVLDLLDDPYTIIMEKGQDPSLRSFFCKAHRLSSRMVLKHLLVGCRNLGAWLDEFHNLSLPEYCEVRHSKAEEVRTILDALIRFVANSTGQPWLSPMLQQRLLVAAETALPAHLPLGLTHTDFAPRNVLLGQNGRVTVLDTMSRWQAPIYEDLAYFVMRLKASIPQMMSQGLMFNAKMLARLETEFLNGYFRHRPIPMEQIRIYECILLLEQWAAMVDRLQTSLGVRRIALACESRLVKRYLSHYICRTLSDIAI